MPPRRVSLISAAVALLVFAAPACSASATTRGKGAKFETLVVGKKTFQHVVVKDVTVRSITILHDDGIASIPLRELPPELQAQFGYNPAAEAAADQKIAIARAAADEHLAELRKYQHEEGDDDPAKKFERLRKLFAQNPEIQADVDLRPRFRQLALGVKDQGRRPSCAIFALVSALEFQNALTTGKSEKLSEEYLLWATQATSRPSSTGAARDADSSEADAAQDTDAGYSLGDVVGALNTYGIAPQTQMPNTFGTKLSDIAKPSDEVIKNAKKLRNVTVHLVPGDAASVRLANFVHLLNESVPVTLGLRFPHERTCRNGFISEQKPMDNYRHAVTLVGYHCDSGQLEDTVFLFRNSYGLQWGEAGYGRVTYRYLAQNLLDAVYLEVNPNVSTPHAHE